MTSKKQMKSASRLYAVQALFQMEASEQGMNEVRDQFVNHRFGATLEGEEYVEGNVELFEQLLFTAVNQQAAIDQMTDRALVAKWPIDRIDPTLRALFRTAGAEFIIDDTPPKVAIVEFVDVAKAFFPDGNETRFVNAILDHMAREVHPDKF
ncbi:transcription antitermination factor NusB [Amylibacter sp.]|mgnify:FL=1|jgi:N utilization substance protein B|nr:transcription antitermination factor NusB [alpha proteobacterium HTCC2255] [Rhodobacterales bacterium HTCC2255]MBT3953422.1 transcription antitermination factor NusB [Rhodobacterales bacterium]MCO4796041.1 transcription antitermination factor NusB [Amylibacter sp.]MBT4134081.1 transcription antitermination factor NusB [Rhodobacterales bacterium]MBT4323086.1 transcription antitermination factor NusB [Rhodobacterales bacterium]|tara:strand:- start:302 stop:757 length:456 start_codon:yes stop_codon:yes gene_type:complete